MAGVDLGGLNPKQREAVLHRHGPLLLLAGAGSGKTRVVTTRIAHLIATGVLPGHILAVTFTNKAAGEMGERVASLVSAEAAKKVTVSTFHSLGLLMLRERGRHIGIAPELSIFDQSDQVTTVRDVMREARIDTERYEPSWMLGRIGALKNGGVSADRYAPGPGDLIGALVADVYRRYTELLRAYSALDFDDLLLEPLRLLREHPAVRDEYRERFRWIMVDEFQDTNGVQLDLVRELADGHRNLLVVGDDDQSIYGWRGAQIENVLAFERHFPDARVLTLDQNYRSVGNVLHAANAVIRNNRVRRDKTLWTAEGQGEPLRYVRLPEPESEARFIAQEIDRLRYAESRPLSAFGVLFRTNGQARALEEGMRFANLPYKLVGAYKFFDRKEVRDALAWIRLLVNERDEVSLRRALAFPPSGIGPASLGRVSAFAHRHRVSMVEALHRADEIDGLNGRIRGTARDLSAIIRRTAARMAPGRPIQAPLAHMLQELRFYEAMVASGDKREVVLSRWRNVQDLLNGIGAYESRKGAEATLEDYLRLIALDTRDDEDASVEKDRLTMMTLHSAKGLEFPVVFLTGLEEGLLPHKRSADEGDVDEERRLFYVGITRARERLVMTGCRRRKRFAESIRCQESRFLDELPAEGVVREDRTDGSHDEAACPEARTAALAKIAALFEKP
ncbi:MAG: DNA helicase [Myxococcales bacterium]